MFGLSDCATEAVAATMTLLASGCLLMLVVGWVAHGCGRRAEEKRRCQRT